MRFSRDARAALVTLTLAAISNGSPAWAQASPSQETGGFDQRLDALFRARNANGGAILDVRSGNRPFVRAYGWLDCAGTRPMRSDALFDGGSLTKLFTQAAIFALVEEGRLKLDDRLGELFRGVPTDKARISVVQLLSHRSGIPNFIDLQGRPLPQSAWSIEGYDYAPLSREKMLALAWLAPLEFQPGAAESYSNYNYNILGAVIEVASGVPYEQYIRDRLFRRLEMQDTGYLVANPNRRPIAEQCRDGKVAGDPITRGVWRNGVSWHLAGAGGMMTTTADLQRWNAGVGEGRLFRPDIATRFRAMYFGPSFRCQSEATFLGGSNGMTRSMIMQLPRRKLAIVAVSLRREIGLPAEDDILDIICPAAG